MSEGSTRQQFARAGGIMVASLFLSRVLGFVRDAVILAKFGKGSVTDAYYASFQIPDLLFYLIAGGALSSAFIPVFSEYLHSDRESEAWHVFSVVVTVMSAVVLSFIVFAWVFAEPLVGMVAGGISEESVPLVAQMSRIIVPAQYAFFIGGVILGTLYSKGVFSVPGLAPNVYNIGIIFGALVLTNFVIPSIAGVSWGALVGAFVGNIFIPLFAIRKIGVKFALSFDVQHEGVKKVFRLMVPVVLGLSLPGIFSWILRNFGSYFEEGAITALDASNRLMQAPLGVFGQALALAVFPVLAQFKAQNRMDLFSEQTSRTLRTTLFLSVPVSMLFIVVPLPIIQAAYVRGKFTLDDAMVTAPLLQMFGIGVAAWCLQPVLMRAYYAVQKTWPPVVMGTATTLLFVGVSFALITGGAGYTSLPLAASGAAIFLALFMIVMIHRNVCALDLAGLGATLWKTIVASATAGAVAWALLSYLPEKIGLASNIALFGLVLIVLCIFGWVYYFVALRLAMPETEYVKRALNKRASRD